MACAKLGNIDVSQLAIWEREAPHDAPKCEELENRALRKQKVIGAEPERGAMSAYASCFW